MNDLTTGGTYVYGGRWAVEVWRLGGLEAGKTGGLEARRPGGLQQSCYESILGAYRKRFGNPGGLETREPRDLEVRRPGGWENWRSGG